MEWTLSWAFRAPDTCSNIAIYNFTLTVEAFSIIKWGNWTPFGNFQHWGRKKEQICILKEADFLVPLESHISSWNEQMSFCSLLLTCEAVNWQWLRCLSFHLAPIAPTKNKPPVLGLSHFHTWYVKEKRDKGHRGSVDYLPSRHTLCSQPAPLFLFYFR